MTASNLTNVDANVDWKTPTLYDIGNTDTGNKSQSLTLPEMYAVKNRQRGNTTPIAKTLQLCISEGLIFD